MQIAAFERHGTEGIGIVVPDGIVDLSPRLPGAATIIEVITCWSEYHSLFASAARSPADFALADIRLLAPVPRPGKILAIGLNYADHVRETGLPMPKAQIWFSKHGNGINAPFGSIEKPPVSDALDYEAELVAIIGKRCRNVPKAHAKEVIFGYCVGNDVSVRDWQLRSPQWMIGKSFDSHAPIGPWITTADQFQPEGQKITASVNGELRQRSTLDQLIFDCADQIAELSQAMTLEPGDLIFTGTPGGVGMGFQPPRYLAVGDVVRVEIEGLGAIENHVVAGSGATMISR